MKVFLILLLLGICATSCGAWSVGNQSFSVFSSDGDETGVVDVWQDGDLLCFDSSRELSMWIGSSLSDLPINHTGQIVGLIYEMGCFNMSFWLEIDLYQCDSFVYAVLVGDESQVPANITFFEDNSTGLMMLPLSCDDEVQVSECVVTAARGKKANAFSELQGEYNIFGYVNGPIFEGPAEFNMTTPTGSVLGVVHLDTNMEEVTLSINANGWGLEAYQIFLGSTVLPKVPVGDRLEYSASPFHFPYQKSRAYGAQFDTYTVRESPPFYFSAQFVLCR